MSKKIHAKSQDKATTSINKCRVGGSEITQKAILFLYISNEPLKKKSRKAVSFAVVSKGIKCQGVN